MLMFFTEVQQYIPSTYVDVHAVILLSMLLDKFCATKLNKMMRPFKLLFLTTRRTFAVSHMNGVAMASTASSVGRNKVYVIGVGMTKVAM